MRSNEHVACICGLVLAAALVLGGMVAGTVQADGTTCDYAFESSSCEGRPLPFALLTMGAVIGSVSGVGLYRIDKQLTLQRWEELQRSKMASDLSDDDGSSVST